MSETVNEKEKELIAVGISVAAGCQPCTDYHLKAVRDAGARSDEVRRTVLRALTVRRNATETMAAHVLERLGKDGSGKDSAGGVDTGRLEELVSVGAAYAVNSAAVLERHIAAARALGLPEEQIGRTVRVAAFIRDMAASHVRKIIEPEGEGAQQPANKAGCCGG